MSQVAQAQSGGTPTPGRDPRAPPPENSECKGCKYWRPRNDWTHTRVIGECAYPYDKPWIPECDACQRRVERWKAGHSYELGKCRFADAGYRRPAAKKKPHEPRLRADSAPTAGMPGTLEGRELGQDGEEEVAAEDERAQRHVQVGGSSSSGGRGQSADAPSNAAAPARRGPDQAQRERDAPQFRDQGDNPERPDDWSNFDIGKVVRLFRTNRSGAIRLTLRKLHVRWWHASESTMKKFLERVGVSQQVLDLIPETVHTCKVCRTWAKPGPDSACAVDIPDQFNAQVECDLMFYEKTIIFHMLDRCPAVACCTHHSR